MAIAAGDRIGPYEVQAPLGAGGMGEVYVAWDTRLRRRVAIKRLIGPAAHSAELRRRALNEARATAKLSHPNIAGVYDVLETDDALLIVMEYVEGRTLAARLQEGRPSLDETVHIVASAADALAAAHRAGVVHRDLKPGNILLTPDGGVKILDFGLAQITAAPSEVTGDEPTTTTTAVESLAGTPAYMAPERVVGKAVDHRGDIYSLGVVLFELLTGRRPFDAPDFLALLTRIATERAPAPHEVDRSVPLEISAVAARAMARDPSDRYATADAFKNDLLAGASPSTVAAGVVVPPLQRWWVRRTRLLVGMLLLAAGAGGLLAWRVSRDKSAPASPPATTTVAILPLTNNTGKSENDYLGLGISDVLAAGLVTLPNVNVVSCARETDCANAVGDPRRAADRLGVALVVSGGVQRVEDDIHVSLQLSDVQSGTLLWGEQFTAPVSALTSVHRRMKSLLAAELARLLSTTPTPMDQLADAGTDNVLAFEQYSQARLLLDRGDIPGNVKRAIQLLDSAIQQDKSFTLAHAALGQAYWMMYEETRDRVWTDRATQVILDALRLDSSQPQVRLSLSTMYFGTGDFAKAEAEARRAIERLPQSDEAHRRLADALIEQGRVDEALEEAQLALRLRPRFWRNHNELGYIHYRQGRFKEAADIYEQSIKLQPDNARAYHMLGSVYLAMGRPEAAIEPITRANEIQPDAVSLSNLGTIHYWAGRYKEAAAAYRQAIKLKPKEPLYYRNLGDALHRLGSRREAADAYGRAVDLIEERLSVSPGDVNTRAMLAVYLAKLGQHARAAQEIGVALDANRASEQVWYRKAVVHALAGDVAHALDALEEAIRLGASRAAAAQDEDFAVLKKHPRFAKLVAES